MKSIIVAFAVLIAGINAIPQKHAVTSADTRLVTDAIASAIEDLSQSIKDNGYDPYLLEREVYVYNLPVPVILSAAALVENVISTGLSNIVINSLNYGVITSRLSFDISLPLVDGSVENVAAEATLFGNKYEAQGSGKLAIRGIRVVGNVRVSIGVISGISVSSVTIDLTLAGIDSGINLEAFGYDLSPYVNNFFSVTIPTTMDTYRSEINELLEIIILDLINDLL